MVLSFDVLEILLTKAQMNLLSETCALHQLVSEHQFFLSISTLSSPKIDFYISIENLLLQMAVSIQTSKENQINN